mgnify:CR=1 FL=1
MIKLILDSSNKSLAVGIADDKVIDSTSYEAWQSQSEHMIPEIDALLNKHNFSRNDIGEVVVTIGPGSYTGIRISLTIAKVVCLALNIPMKTLSSLSALQDLNKPSICLMDARSGRSYIGVYDKDKVLLSDQVMNNDDVINYINTHKEFAICGDLKYLGLSGYINDLVFTMNELSKTSKIANDPLVVKPVYLKDEYAIK